MSLHFAGVPEYSPAHVMLMVSIGKALRRRGHRFTIFQAAQVLAHVDSEDVEVCALDSDGSGSVNQGPAEDLRFLCSALPRAARKAGVDCIVSDSMMPAGAAVADALGIPFVTLSAGTPINSEPNVPPSFAPWLHRDCLSGRLRNRIAYCARDLFLRPALTVLNDFRRQYKLPDYRCPEDSLSRLAQLSPLIKEFDFPRSKLPACFHYVGPFERTDPPSLTFPYHRLSEQPLAYFCCGTVSAMSEGVLDAIVRATRNLGVQLIVSAGKIKANESLPEIGPHVIHVNYAPQRALLRRAKVCITHGGLNSTLESLMAGVPLIALPKLRFDHPGVAARIAYHRVGKVLTGWQRRRVAHFNDALTDLLEKPVWCERARHFQDVIGRTAGAEAAASIIEKAARTGRPVEAI